MTNQDKSPLSPEAVQLQAELRHYTGDLERVRHPLKRQLIYTPGVHHLAEAAGAYWLIDIVASWIGSHTFEQERRSNPSIEGLHTWSLEVAEDASAVVRAFGDNPEPPFAPKVFITQRIPFTDFILPEINLWCGFDGEHWTLYLPSEH